MTFVNAGTLGTVSGHRDELVAILTQRNDLLRELGCSVYEVGINADAPDTVFVVEVWAVVSAPITGARKPAHLDDAIASLDIVLTQDEVAQLEAPYTPHPVAGF